MDKAIWGHKNAKEQIMQMMAQEINNPDSKGNVMALMDLWEMVKLHL